MRKNSGTRRSDSGGLAPACPVPQSPEATLSLLSACPGCCVPAALPAACVLRALDLLKRVSWMRVPAAVPAACVLRWSMPWSEGDSEVILGGGSVSGGVSRQAQM